MKTLNQVECIFERVYIETPVDTDGDGRYDLVAAYIHRPKSTLQGEKVPAVLVANPYLMFCNEDWYDLHNVNCEVKAYPEQNISEESIRFDFSKEPVPEIKETRETRGFADSAILDEEVEFECISPLYAYLNQKGYGTVFCGGLGTRGSDGFTICGCREEIMTFRAVIDWLCGRTRAFTNRTDNIEIKADWCTGSVAMSAKSYLGTMCIGVAATGVEGLKAIIPEAGICNWYDYYRCNGLNVPALGWQGDDIDLLAKYCFSRAKDPEDYDSVKDAYEVRLDEMRAQMDRDSGNYNLFWDARNYLNQIENFKAAVFIIQGLNDWNVKTNQCSELFTALEKQGAERKMLLHQGPHMYVYDLEGADTMRQVEGWLDHYLKGVDNGIEKEPKVRVESNLDQLQWMESESWPPKNMEYRVFPIAKDEKEAVIVDDISATAYDFDKDNLRDWLDELVLCDRPDYQNRLKYVWNPDTEENLRISGKVKVSFEAALDRKTAILSAMLVDIGEECRLTEEQVDLGNGEFRFGTEEKPSAYRVISRGWLNAQNRSCLWSKEELEPGRSYSYSFDMVQTDYTLRAGHQLAVILYGIDAEATQRPKTVTRITVNPATVQVQVPFVG